MGFILVEQTQTSVEHTKFSLLYFVEHNQTMLVEHNHTMPVEHTNVTRMAIESICILKLMMQLLKSYLTSKILEH